MVGGIIVVAGAIDGVDAGNTGGPGGGRPPAEGLQCKQLMFITGWGSNFKEWNFKMADFSNLKINERSNVELPKLRVNKVENKKWIWELAKLRVVRNIEKMGESKIAKFWFYKLNFF